MDKTKYVFVILVYRNYKDLDECVESIKEKINDFRIIVVNAYYDDETMNAVKGLSEKHNCHFINIENKGYSFGNNRGIEYAEKNFEYDYLIVSNADIVIKHFDTSKLETIEENSIIVPKIIAADGRYQNPMLPMQSKLSDRLTYKGLKNSNKFLFFLGVGISKIHRTWFLIFNKNKIRKVYAAHGSFVVFSRGSLQKLEFKPYDENMFLFAEESVLAEKAKISGIKTLYYPFFSIYHKEDGSMKLADFSINKELVKSNIYFYETYVLGNKKANEEHHR